jgi:hypothetical protein
MITFENIVLIITKMTLTLSSLCLVLLVRPGGYTVNLSVIDFYKVIEKLTSCLQIQEFDFLKQTVDYSTSSSRCSPRCERK